MGYTTEVTLLFNILPVIPVCEVVSDVTKYLKNALTTEKGGPFSARKKLIGYVFCPTTKLTTGALLY